MNRILIFTENKNFCSANDIFYGLMAEPEIVSDICLLYEEISSKNLLGLVIDGDFVKETDLDIIEHIVNSDINLTTAVFITAGTDITRFSKMGITSFVTEHTKKESIRPLFSLNTLSRRQEVFFRFLAKLRSLAQSIDQGILLLNTEGKITFANPAACSILGKSAFELSRKSPDDIFSEHPYVLPPQSPEKTEQFIHKTNDGKTIALDTYITPTYDNSIYTGCIIIFSKPSGQSLDRKKELELLKFQERYHSTQQSAAFKKQMLVIKDEVSGMFSGGYAFETYFKPLDVMSGDIYGTINLKDGRYLLYIIDAMGKGLSASVTALQSSSFINHSVEQSLIKNDFDFSRMISSFTHYIRDRLMEEEALCAIFALIDTETNMLSLCNFGMPPVMVCYDDEKIERLKTPSLPIMRFMAERHISSFSMEGVSKLLIYSDGLSEAQTKDDEVYFVRLDETLRNAATKKHLLKLVNKDIKENDDDITFFFIRKLGAKSCASESFSIKSSQHQLALASEKINEFMSANSIDISDTMTMEFALSEMLMNAMEHGSFGITFAQKQNMIAEGTYDDFIEKMSAESSPDYEKPIDISCEIHCYEREKQLLISIKDTGRGFAVSEIFKFHSFDGNLSQIDEKKYNGRGIFITDNLVDGLFYNEKGNRVYILKVLEN